MNKKIEMSKTKKVTISAIIMAVYVVVMMITQGIAFGFLQIRVATAIYSTAYLFPFLILPLGLSNSISNMLLGGLGIFDTVGGFVVGVITSSLIYLIRRCRLPVYLIAIPIIAGPGLIVPIWLSKILGVPYWTLAASVCAGQIVPGILGVVLVKVLENKAGE